MQPQQNEDRVRALVEQCVNTSEVGALNRFVAEDVRVHPGTPGAGPATEGLAALREAFLGLHQVFPDLRITIEDVIAADDRVAARWTARGTHRAEFLGIAPTGTPVCWGGTDIYRLVDGKIVEWWRNDDLVELLKQLRRNG
jgi:predicted ester cyclase